MTISANGRYLVDQISQPTLLVGDTAWSGIAQLTSAEIDTYLEDRASRGFNCVLVNLFEHLFATNAPNNINGDAPFAGTPYQSALGSNYMALADHFISKAESLGIYVLLDVSYLGYAGTKEGWDTEIAAASTTNMNDVGIAVANLFANYKNVIWVNGGDQDPSSYMTKLTALANGILSIDSNHLFTMHIGGDPSTAEDAGSQSWLTLNDIYASYLDIPNEGAIAWAVSPTMPFFMIEGYYANDRATDQQCRQQNYSAVLVGALGGFVFGTNLIWKFAYDGGDWTKELASQGSLDAARAGTFFNSIAWYSLVPDTSHNVLTAGYGTIGTADYAPCAIDAGGTLAVIYMPSNRSMTVDMSQFSGTVTARWFDPTDGSYIADAASPLSNTGTHNFSRASTNSTGDADWILILEVG